jgi:hypothetical protein
MKTLYTLAAAHRGITARIIEKDIPKASVHFEISKSSRVLVCHFLFEL